MAKSPNGNSIKIESHQLKCESQTMASTIRAVKWSCEAIASSSRRKYLSRTRCDCVGSFLSLNQLFNKFQIATLLASPPPPLFNSTTCKCSNIQSSCHPVQLQLMWWSKTNCKIGSQKVQHNIVYVHVVWLAGCLKWFHSRNTQLAPHWCESTRKTN